MSLTVRLCVCVRVCLCVCEGEREGEVEADTDTNTVTERETETKTQRQGKSLDQCGSAHSLAFTRVPGPASQETAQGQSHGRGRSCLL